eukprot:gene4670-6561_t
MSPNEIDQMKKVDQVIPFNIEQIEKYASKLGILIRASEVGGVFLRLEAYTIGPTGSNESAELIGYLTGFIRPIPFKLFQLDTIQVKNRRQTLGFKRKNWKMDGPGISFIMGSWALKWAYDRGCKSAELLAVRDSDRMHDILVKLYQSFGFVFLRAVNDDSGSIPDRLVWGAVGTLMKLDITKFWKEWTPKFIELNNSLLENNDSNS